MLNEYYPSLAVIKEIKKETYNTNTYALAFSDSKLSNNFSWSPGQFMMLSILGVGESAISISDVDKDNLISATVRNVGNVTNSLLCFKKDDVLGIRGPYGTGWPLKEIKGKDVLLIAGGMGLAPLRGVIHHIMNNRKDYGYFEIIYGARTPEDMIYRYEFELWGKIKNSKLHFTADEILGKNPFECRICLVTSCFPMMNTRHRNAVALVCGPEIMMRYVAKCLETIGFADKQIFLSLERRMKCGIGKCGHCQIGINYVCKDGPVFNYADIKPFIRPL